MAFAVRIVGLLSLAVLLLCTAAASATAGGHPHHAAPWAQVEAQAATAAEAEPVLNQGCPKRDGERQGHEPSSCCGVGCATAIVEEPERGPAGPVAAGPPSSPPAGRGPRRADTFFHPPRPTA